MGLQAAETESVCPICLRRIGAKRVCAGDDAFLVKECPEHGLFRTVLWRGPPSLDQWQRHKNPVHPSVCYAEVKEGCPFDCGLCAEHRQLPCSVLLEVTERCNLRCAVCFADAGGSSKDPSVEELSRLLERAMTEAGRSNLQLSGGEPTLRDDLPHVVEVARRVGYSFIQLNTNGLRLGEDVEYAKDLGAAGLSSVFLQFDGVDDDVHRTLRGRPLLDPKLLAIRNCGEAGLGVVLVPTLVRGLNTHSLGALVRKALELSPTVRGVHFQPISYFGRVPEVGGDEGRFTLPELMRGLEEQTSGLVRVSDFSPPGCEHAHCSCHATYLYSSDGALRSLGTSGEDCCTGGGVGRTVETVSRRWALPVTGQRCCSGEGDAPKTGRGTTRIDGPIVLDAFLAEGPARTFTLSAMVFQDAENLDLERLRGCCISNLTPDGKLVPFCAYNLTNRAGRSLYRGRGARS